MKLWEQAKMMIKKKIGTMRVELRKKKKKSWKEKRKIFREMGFVNV